MPLSVFYPSSCCLLLFYLVLCCCFKPCRLSQFDPNMASTRPTSGWEAVEGEGLEIRISGL